MVDGGANLSRVEAFHKQQAFSRLAQGVVVADDGGRFATHFQCHRAQVGGCCCHDGAARQPGAGEQQVVKLELGKLDADAAGFVEEGELFPGEIGRAFFNQQFRQVAGILRHFHHGAVACGEGGNQAAEAEIDREIPGHDGTHNAQGLGYDAVAGAKEILPVDAPALRFHPLFQVFEGVIHPVHDTENLGEKGLMARAVAIVRADGRHDGVAVVTDEGFYFEQVSLAL